MSLMPMGAVPMPRRSVGRRVGGFTLVELLVVVAVIALLIAVLLPTLGGARDSARSLQALSNMRQLAIGWAIYASDADGVVVAGQPGRYADERLNVYDVGNGEHYRPRWFAAMGAKAGFHAYLVPSADPTDEHSKPVDGDEVFRCPVAETWTSTRNYPFGYNYQFLGNARFVNNDAAEGFINYPKRVSSIAAATNTVMFASSLGTAAGKPAVERTPNRPDGSRDPDLCALGGHGYALDPPRLTDNCDFADRRNRSPEHRSAPDPRYRGKANVMFCDGHGAARSLGELGYQVAEDGRVLADGPDATNKLFSGDNTDADPPTLRR